MAIDGSSAGPAATSQASVSPLGAAGSWAVPVLAITENPTSFRMVAVPFRTTWRIPSRTGPSTPANGSGLGATVGTAEAVWSGAAKSRPRRGVTS